ncbi:MAG: 50S ribosomal protein L25 [Candidatus Hydrogenedentes bacterium]|nr:50S ribosomal protein L25 [Candidatus Hydrogenedentota bacterium]
MELQTLKAVTREPKNKGHVRATRRSGNVPAVLYGGGQPPVMLKMNELEFTRILHGRQGEHAIVQLQLDDQPDLGGPALLKEVQHHPVRGDVIHADFQRIRLDEKITTQVPLRLVGHARGVVDGGVIDFQLREVEVECLALEVPDGFEVDISDMGIGDNIHLAQLTAPQNVTIVTSSDRVIVSCMAPRLVKEEVVAVPEEGAPAEPEVIGEKERAAKEVEEKPEKEKEREKGKKEKD